jgi:very-short-patch-repair endonuclease
VAERLAELGITVVAQYGVGGYRVDFAAAHPDDPSRMILAVEADGASYRDSGSVRDRDRLRKEHLERLGWRVHRLWSTNWFTDPDTELAKLRAAYGEAVRTTPPAPPPAPEPGSASSAPIPPDTSENSGALQTTTAPVATTVASSAAAPASPPNFSELTDSMAPGAGAMERPSGTAALPVAGPAPACELPPAAPPALPATPDPGSP